MTLRRRVWITGAVLVGALGALLALIPFAPGALIVVVLVVLLASSPGILRRVSKHAGLAAGMARPVAGSTLPRITRPSRQSSERAARMRAPAAAMTDHELVFAWRLSCIHRGHVHTAADTLELARQRAALLDEVERRDPAGFAAWLHGGVQGLGDPGRFLRSRAGTASEGDRRRPGPGSPLEPEDGS